MFLGKKVHILTEVITEHSRAMVIEAVVFVFGAVWVVGWYLEWALPSPLIDSLVCVIWMLYGSLILQDMNVTQQFVIYRYLRTLEHWVPGWYYKNGLQRVHHRLEPYEWVAAGPPGCVCCPYIVMVLCVSHELIFLN